ncbi:hypothetical protein GCM10007160_03920 [Litchfieldella qijiaojingensis]|uniref:Baseplate assembly protein n=1 Tax=Litchfieldella qijiaojingensis TaxID=980347 RepID=A0ABQ2YCI3_9GAMM|nr:hypothetical protein [Halomonas qijiaojingensis]GGX79740.1 hypothetical protein GCM10007160_03920 [Halomonas qijiaojingensis]
MSCVHDCKTPPVFPLRIDNRRGLPAIQYRIGDYGSFREHMLDRLDKSRTLADWTHRGSDDPGISLIEGTAIVADILSFYQTLYANETLIRTARWRESVNRLVQLSGYRMAPGVAGEATFALTVQGEDAATIPKGFGFKVELEGRDEAVVFETTRTATAYPAQNEFHLYRPRKGLQPVTTGLTALEMHAVDGDQDVASLASIAFRPGDRILLLPDLTPFASGGGSYDASHPQARPEIVIVKRVERVLNRIIVHFEGALTIPRDAIVEAYVIDRSFRHFGHNAPARIGRLNEATGFMTMEATDFERRIYGTDFGDGEFYSTLPMLELPLDQDVDDVAVGSKLICHGLAEFDGSGGSVPFTVVRSIEALRSDTLVWGGVSGACAVVSMDARMIANLAILNEKADIRRLQIHEAVSPTLQFRAPSDWHSGPFPVTESGYEIHYYGLLGDAARLVGRELMLAGDDGRMQTVKVLEETTLDASGRDPAQPWLWPLMFDQQPIFERDWFKEEAPRVTVHGNLVHADQGETQKPTVLGSGDGRRKFQTLSLPKHPLTYRLLSEATPPQVPALEVHVDGVRWRRVDTFFNAGPSDRVYVVREDEEGNSYIQCGDGINGAVFPSGRHNIEVVFRKGVGGRGEAAGKPKPTGKLKPLKEAVMLGPAVGGGDPETMQSAREAAPARMQSLGRLVGLADYEAETLALPGVLKARADWVAPTGTPRIRLTVLSESGDPAEVNKVRQSLQAANRCRGASRHPIQVINGVRKFVLVDLSAGFDPDYRSEDIRAAILGTLGAWGAEGDSPGITGLFALAERRFGQGAHVSQILAAVQNIEGVNWVRVDAFLPLPLGSPPETDPSELTLPASPVREARIDCSSAELLSLYQEHLVINLSADTLAEACDP